MVLVRREKLLDDGMLLDDGREPHRNDCGSAGHGVEDRLVGERSPRIPSGRPTGMSLTIAARWPCTIVVTRPEGPSPARPSGRVVSALTRP